MESDSPATAPLLPREGLDHGTVREQLERMLADPLFKHSKRYPNLLRYVVERTLDGEPSGLKERTLGVAVFGREPAYDTSTDPIVRATAGEIRKRIAQYYQEPGREHEIRIGLSPGSYVPEFAMPPATRPAAPSQGVSRSPAGYQPRLRHVAVAIVAAAMLLVGALWTKPWVPRAALDGFWRPILDSSNSVLICIGQRRFLATSPESPKDASPDLERVRKDLDNPNSPISLFRLYYMGSQNLAFPDVVTFGDIAGLLHSNGKTYRVRGESSTSFSDLREGPVILIGAFNNDWTMRLMGPLRFNFARDGDTFWIEDRQNPARRNRIVDYSKPYLDLGEDYAVISRGLEPTTGRMAVMIGGLTGYGTMAAAEFLSNPSLMEAAIQQAPRDWRRKNIQFVIATKVIDGGSGPPRVVDRYFW
jgi:hypothetical protein